MTTTKQTHASRTPRLRRMALALVLGAAVATIGSATGGAGKALAYGGIPGSPLAFEPNSPAADYPPGPGALDWPPGPGVVGPEI